MSDAEDRTPGSPHRSDLPIGAAEDTTRGRPEGFYLTPDTAPVGLSVKRTRLVAPLFLVTFAAGVVLSNKWFPRLIDRYAGFLKGLVGASHKAVSSEASVAIRPLFLLLVVLFALLLSGSLARRLRFFVVTLTSFAVLCGASDALLLKLSAHGLPGPFGITGNVVCGIEGIVSLAIGIFVSAALPPGVRVREEVRRGWGGIVAVALALALTSLSVVAVLHYLDGEIRAAQRIPVLAGVGSGLVLFFGLLFFFLYWLDWIRPKRLVAAAEQLPTVAIVVPARNEEGLITDCIRSIDEAARTYPNRCSVYVVENGSSDGTYGEAARALGSVRNVRGVLLQCEPSGKAYALNVGITQADEEIVLRIDADTVVTSSVLFGLMRHFSNEQIGGVSGLPLPRTRASWICRMRAIEVYYQVGFKRAGYNAVDSVGVLPGALVAYRRHLLVKLNGFAQGINGEDADMTVRVGRLGYRILSDPTVRAYTEMPTTFAYLREQRMRWSRGTYHMLARNKSGIAMAQGLRCIWVLPWAGFVMFRRLMILPFAAAAIALVIQSHSILAVADVAAGGAIVLGFQLLQMAACMLFFREASLIADIPSYVIFRLIVSFYSLETLLGLSFRPRPDVSSTAVAIAASPP